MALIGTIRKNGWILIGTMILALGGFILMDIVGNTQRYSQGGQNTLGKVNGKEIGVKEFDRYQKVIYANSQGNEYQVRQQVWNQFVEDAIVREQSAVLGLDVSRDELMDLQYGNSLSPIIQQRYSAQGGQGQIDRNSLNQIKAAFESGEINDDRLKDFRVRWSIQEGEIVKQRLQDKISSLITKSFYGPSWQAEMTFKETNERLDFLYVRVPYEKVADNEIQVTDDDYAAYLKENPKLYDQTEETRLLSYVAFDVLATNSDSTAAKTKVTEMISGMMTKDDSVYVVTNGGIYGGGFKKKSALPEVIANQMMTTAVDSVVGPYLDAGAWTVAKILDRKVMPDSVRARHILIREATPENGLRIDSIKNLINTGKGRFDSLAVRMSQDPGSGAKGGDLGWFGEGMMVPEFNDVCFNGDQGKLYTVKSQFGWHLIEITGKKFIKNEASVKAAYLSERIVPSPATQTTIKNKAIALIKAAKDIADLDQKAKEQNLALQVSQPLKSNDFSLGLLGSGKDAREVIRWAFEGSTKVGAISKEPFAFTDNSGGFFDSKYAIVALKGIAPKGAANVEALKANPAAELEVKNRKKAAVILAKLQGAGTDMAAAAAAYGVAVDTAVGANMAQASLKTGSEPKVVGTAFGLAKGSVSKPIAGRGGVYIIQPITDKTQIPLPADLTAFRRQAASTAQSSVRVNLMNSLKKDIDIVDNRSIQF